MELDNLNSLSSGASLAIVGGGPGGCSTALTILKWAKKNNIQIHVRIFEHKRFGEHYNQCLGVLSPPINSLLKDFFDIEIPESIVKRRISLYRLYGKHTSLDLIDTLGREASFVVQRAEFDSFLMKKVIEAGGEWHQDRVTALEFHPEDVVVYTEAETYSVSAVIGAFGLDSTLRSSLRRASNYDPPSYLETVVTTIKPPESHSILKENIIHTFLPPLKNIEFSAIVPKGGHISIVVAGKRVGVKNLKKFLALEEVKRLLNFPYSIKTAFKGSFPNRPSRAFFGNRWVIIGDGSGLIRPFKGKGINAAIKTGHIAALTMLEDGISKRALYRVKRESLDVIRDRVWGQFARLMAHMCSKTFGMDMVLFAAKRNKILMQALFDAVSGFSSYKKIILSCFNPSVIFALAIAFFSSRRIKRL